MALGALGGLDPAIRYRLSHAAVSGHGVRPGSADHYTDAGRDDDLILVRRDDLAALLEAALDGVKP